MKIMVSELDYFLMQSFDTQVPSDDMFTKFGLTPAMESYFSHQRLWEDSPPHYSSKNDNEYSSEIRNHDCMWAGLCVSKEHNRTLPTKKDCYSPRKIQAGRSVLISQFVTANEVSQTRNNTYKSAQRSTARTTDALESDGGSPGPATPQSLESDVESDCDVPIFKHEQIDINERLSECMSGMTTGVSVSEVTGQLARNITAYIKTEIDISDIEDCKDDCKESEVRNTLSDHCYHLNQEGAKRVDSMGVPTPSDSEEEIDVVSCDKSCRSPLLARNQAPVDHQTLQMSVNSALAEKPAPRPRGRPPSNPNRKRAADQQNGKPAKRAATQRKGQKKTKAVKIEPAVIVAAAPPTPVTTEPPEPSESEFDEELDTDKRHLHNNMERQRRIELRNAFDDLRRLVPEIEAKEKAPKVAILRQAGKYCQKLRENDLEWDNRIEELKKKQQKLRARVSYLRRCLAMTR